MKSFSRLIFIGALITISGCGIAQPNWKYEGFFNLGCNLTFTYSKSQQFPGLRLYAAFIANGIYKKNFTVNYGPSISVYTKTIGANLNPLINDIQIDFINSFSIGGTWGKDLNYTKFFKTINTGPFYNIVSSKKYATYLSTNFIVNSHKRNQIVGSLSFSTPDFSVNYYNDGAIPFNILPLADNFDRWWTGGFGIYVHNHKNYNIADLSFDQFTGYEPLLYELSNLIGINIPMYNLDTTSINKRTSNEDYNTSSYDLKIFFSKGYAIDANISGSLVTKRGRAFGLQDIIHRMLHYPLHPNNDDTKIYLGATYNNMNDVKL